MVFRAVERILLIIGTTVVFLFGELSVGRYLRALTTVSWPVFVVSEIELRLITIRVFAVVWSLGIFTVGWGLSVLVSVIRW